MKKKVLAILLVVFLLVLAGCSGNTSPQQNPSDTSGGTNAASAVNEEVKSNFPEKNITLIAPYAPGGGTDRVSRILAETVSKYLPNNVKVIVENKEGGSSTIGLTYLYNAKPDGYTLAITMETGVAIKTLTDKLDYEWDSFTEIMTLTNGAQFLVVKKDAPWNTAEEWMQYVKDNPGKFRIGHGGVGSIGHLAIEEVKAKAGLEFVTVPYNGTGPILQALLAGDVEAGILAASQVDAELTKPLFNIGTQRTEGFDVPVLSELGLDVGSDSWIGLIAPPGLPEYEFQVIHDAFKKALEDPEVIEKLMEGYSEPFYSGPEQFRKLIEERYNINEEIMKNIGMIQ